MEFELINHSQRIIFHRIEIRVVAITGNEIAILPIPLGMLNTHILGRYHLTVEHDFLAAVLLVVLLNQSQDCLNELQILGIVINLQSHKLGSLYQTIDTDGEILTAQVDVTCIKQRKHTILLKFLEVFVISQLHLVAEVNNMREVFLIVEIVIDSILYATIQVDSEHALRTGRNSTGSQRIAEPVVLYLVTQTTARAEAVGIVAEICEEAVTLGVHLGCKLSPLLVLTFTILGKHGHGLDREGKHRLGALLVEPLHESFLQP